MSHDTVTLGDRGRIVIPAETRKRLDLKPGDRLAIREDAGEIRLMPLTDRIKALRGAWADAVGGRDLVEELRAERRAAAERE